MSQSRVDEVNAAIETLSDAAKNAGYAGALADAMRKIEAMTPVVDREDDALTPGEVMAYRRAKRQALAILATLSLAAPITVKVNEQKKAARPCSPNTPGS